MRLRSWTGHRCCAYRLPRTPKVGRYRTRCVRRSVCWGQDRRRLQRTRPGTRRCTGPLIQHLHKGCARLSKEARSHRGMKTELPRRIADTSTVCRQRTGSSREGGETVEAPILAFEPGLLCLLPMRVQLTGRQEYKGYEI